jgi:hypothetical protein
MRSYTTHGFKLEAVMYMYIYWLLAPLPSYIPEENTIMPVHFSYVSYPYFVLFVSDIMHPFMHFAFVSYRHHKSDMQRKQY